MQQLKGRSSSTHFAKIGYHSFAPIGICGKLPHGNAETDLIPKCSYRYTSSRTPSMPLFGSLFADAKKRSG